MAVLATFVPSVFSYKILESACAVTQNTYNWIRFTNKSKDYHVVINNFVKGHFLYFNDKV